MKRISLEDIDRFQDEFAILEAAVTGGLLLLTGYLAKDSSIIHGIETQLERVRRLIMALGDGNEDHSPER